MTTIKEQIEFLKQFPEDMEVWRIWDESGEASPAKEPIGEKMTIGLVYNKSKKKTRYEEIIDDPEYYSGKFWKREGGEKIVVVI